MNRSNIFTGILIIVLIALAYLWYSYLQNRPDASVSSVTPNVSEESRQLLVLLQVLEDTKIDISLFQNPLFSNLKEGISLPDFPPRGRVNPFRPL
jgi:hypothetical protein